MEPVSPPSPRACALGIYRALRGEFELWRKETATLDEAARHGHLTNTLRFLRALPTAWLHISRGAPKEARPSVELMAALDPGNLYYRAWERLLSAQLGVARPLDLVEESLTCSRHPDVRSAQTLIKGLCLQADLLRSQHGPAAQWAAKEAVALATARDTWCEHDQIVAFRAAGQCFPDQAEAYFARSLAMARQVDNLYEEALTLAASGETSRSREILARLGIERTPSLT